MKSIVLSLLGFVLIAQQAGAVPLEAPIGHRQPTIASVTQAQREMRLRSAAETRMNEVIQRNEDKIRSNLNICRRC
jgi:hypothetical protein